MMRIFEKPLKCYLKVCRSGTNVSSIKSLKQVKKRSRGKFSVGLQLQSVLYHLTSSEKLLPLNLVRLFGRLNVSSTISTELLLGVETWYTLTRRSKLFSLLTLP